MCDPCLEVATRDVRALTLDYFDLEQQLVAVNLHGVFVSGTREPPTPYAVGIDILQHDIWHTLTTWEEIVREHEGLPGAARQVRAGWAVQHATMLLASRMTRLVTIGPVAVYPLESMEPTDQTGLDAALTLMYLHRKARAALGLTRRVEELYGACPQCGWSTLQREYGSETVSCANCHDLRTWDDYRRWLALTHEYAKATRKSEKGKGKVS